MAETFLSLVIEKLVDLIIEEAKSLKGVHKQVKSLKMELEIIEPLLRDAEAKSAKGELGNASKVWLRQLRDEAEHIEDIVDDYTYLLDQSRHGEVGFTGTLRKATRRIAALKTRSDLASKIRYAKESLQEIKDRGLNYGLIPFKQGGPSSSVDPRIGSLLMDDNELVGIEHTSNELVRSLAEGQYRLLVISLIGEGGIGKTTLARKVYNNVVAIGCFDHHVWVTVSQSYDIDKILKLLMSKINPVAGREIIAIEETFAFLRNSLQAKRYVIVFDDVWQTEFWSVIKYALPSNNNGSRILVTTRNSKVVESFDSVCSEIVVRELKPWSAEQAWELFCKKAFPSSNCPPELKQLSHEILRKCQGLLLAIVAVAGLLSKKKSNVEWQQVLDNLNKELDDTGELSSVSKILLLSYHDLPYHLKPCFLYFSIFPEDFSIRGEKLCQIWIAEGFIKSRDGKTLEQIANKYLIELSNRNLVLSRFKFGSDIRYKVHDLMRDVILTRTSDLHFCEIFDPSKLNYGGKCPRRLIIHDAAENLPKTVGGYKIRSVALFSTKEVTNSFVVGLFQSCKLLKVLDFEYAPLSNLTKEVENLFHLKYLNLKGTQVKTLPKSIGKLRNLQVLDVSHTLVKELPIEVNKLRKLRHLVANILETETEYSVRTYIGVRLHDGIGKLEELQTLTKVEAHSNQASFIEELSKLRNLKCLGISKVTTEMGRALGKSFEKMNNLKKLLLSSINQEEVLYMDCVLSPPLLLRYLRLSCRLESLPTWISNLKNLQGLELNFSRLVDDPLQWLKSLPNLTYLRMYQAYDGEELHFKEGEFQKLKELRLARLEVLKVMKIERKALPLLERLDIGPFPQMTEIPSNFQHLTNLKNLRVIDMPSEFSNALRPGVGSGYYKIQHIPSVTYWCYEGKGIF